MNLDIVEQYKKSNPSIEYSIKEHPESNIKGFYCSVQRIVEIYINNIESEEDLFSTLRHETFHIKLIDSFFLGFQGVVILNRVLKSFHKLYPEQTRLIKKNYQNSSNINISCECLAFYSEEHINYKPSIKDRINYFLIFSLIKRNFNEQDIKNIVNIILKEH